LKKIKDEVGIKNHNIDATFTSIYWVVVDRYFSMCSVIVPNYDLSCVQQMKHMYSLFNKMQETLIYYIEKACTSRQ